MALVVGLTLGAAIVAVVAYGEWRPYEDRVCERFPDSAFCN